ncbi:MAG: hypothetical protein U9Q81_00135 [Pseudomonadota bacterium]|nr:hypothetical protein [Pseudomonadota bacterium]
MLIRTTSTFAQLHKAIQQSLGWQDYHLWEFRLPTFSGRSIAGLPTDDNDFGRPTPDAREIKLSSYKLADMRRTRLTKLGRGSGAFASAWSEFEKYPCRPAYDQLMKYVPKGERAAWHDKAIDTSARADLHSVIELWLATKETSRLSERLRAASHDEIESLSHYTTEPAAKKLVRSHPGIAAKVYRALGMRVLNAKKSKYYDAALSHFEQAKRCYLKAGLGPAWDELVDKIRRNHGRKSSFMPGFERLVQGKKPDARPSFNDRTKRRKGSWTRRGGSGSDTHWKELQE